MSIIERLASVLNLPIIPAGITEAIEALVDKYDGHDKTLEVVAHILTLSSTWSTQDIKDAVAREVKSYKHHLECMREITEQKQKVVDDVGFVRRELPLRGHMKCTFTFQVPTETGVVSETTRVFVANGEDLARLFLKARYPKCGRFRLIDPYIPAYHSSSIIRADHSGATIRIDLAKFPDWVRYELYEQMDGSLEDVSDCPRRMVEVLMYHLKPDFEVTLPAEEPIFNITLNEGGSPAISWGKAFVYLCRRKRALRRTSGAEGKSSKKQKK